MLKKSFRVLRVLNRKPPNRNSLNLNIQIDLLPALNQVQMHTKTKKAKSLC